MPANRSREAVIVSFFPVCQGLGKAERPRKKALLLGLGLL